jgi:hypothetical protein
MAAKADAVDVEIEELGENKLVGAKMMDYFKKQDAVILTKAMFLTLDSALK